MPLFVGMFFVFVVMGSAGYLLQAVTTEKENRVAEVMFTSLWPLQLIGGKAIGLMGVGFHANRSVAAGVRRRAARSPPVRCRSSSDRAGLTLVAHCRPLFRPHLCVGSGDHDHPGQHGDQLQQGQQISGMINMLFMLPFFFFVLVFTKPDSPLMVALTLFPTTAFMTVAMRWGVTTVPAGRSSSVGHCWWGQRR